jgi:hypothetical protein
MKSESTVDRQAPKKSDLDSRYGAVGILAVAAALPYQSDAKNSAYAPIDARFDDRFVNASASS